MATVHAGVKRSFDQAQDSVVVDQRRPSSVAFSRGSSPAAKDANGRTQGFVTPSKEWESSPRTATFSKDASIVLLGLRGVGKSSLGVLAAAAYNRRLIESDKAFCDATGLTNSAYRKTHGTANYLKKHHQILRALLESFTKNCVIICNFPDLENQGASIIAEFAQTHPVVHVNRDVKGIQSQMRVWSEKKVCQLLHTSSAILRACSNFEFYNLSEKVLEEQDLEPQSARSICGSSLTLKRVERDFLKMIRNIIGDHEREQSHHSAYPLSQFPVHKRCFTLSAKITIDQTLDPVVDLDKLQIGVDAVELQVRAEEDFTRPDCIARAFAILRRNTILPIIITPTYGATAENGNSQILAELISYCLRLAPEFCTFNLCLGGPQLAVLLAQKGLTRTIGAKHFFKRPPQGWNDDTCMVTFSEAGQLGCDLLKITMPAHSMRDNFVAQGFREKVEATAATPRIICYNTGRRGKSSLCFNSVLTPVNSLTEAELTEDLNEHTHARVTSKEVFQSMFSAYIYEGMNFFIYGANVSYSLSPAMHNAAYEACGMPHKFGHHSSPTLDEFEKLTREIDFGGAAVVQPYKTGVLPLLDGLSSHAKAIGAVNTIIPVRELNEDGSLPNELEIISQLNRQGPVKALYGHNTDWIGIRACLRRGLSPANTIRPQSTGLVCGAGGQARSTIYAMLSLGLRNIFVCNRTATHAQRLADHYNGLIQAKEISELDPNNSNTRIHVIENFSSAWPNDFRRPTLIVSGIPTQSSDGSPINFVLPDDWLSSPTGGVVVELAYRPTLTPIVEQMRDKAKIGWNLMDGFDVLPEQAFAQFELFTGRRAPRKLMRDQVIERHRAEHDQKELQGMNLDPNPAGR